MNAPGSRQEYSARINRVLDYIETRLDRELNLEELARVASFSPFHFHRLFRAALGESLGRFIQRLRLERAARSLLSEPAKPVTHVALDCGFTSSAAFTRSFRARFGCSPSAYRRSGPLPERNPGTSESKPGQAFRNGWKSFPEDSVHIEYRTGMEVWRMDKEKRSVEVRDVPARTVAYVRHVGPYKGDAALFGRLFERLFRWAGPRNLVRPGETQTLVIYHDDPEITAEQRQRVSACLTVPEGTRGEGEIGTLVIPAGRCAVTRFVVRPDGFQQAWDWVYGTWLPQSGYAPDDRPCYELYPEERRADGSFVIDIYAPVKPL